MTKVDYKRIWQEFKEELTKEYLRLRGVNQERYRVHAIATGIMLCEMDKLDGTNEFHNLLHDLGLFNEEDE